MIPVRYRWGGDKLKAHSLKGFGRKLLGDLETRLGGLNNGRSRHIMPDGTTIVCEINHGLSWVTITTAPQEESIGYSLQEIEGLLHARSAVATINTDAVTTLIEQREDLVVPLGDNYAQGDIYFYRSPINLSQGGITNLSQVRYTYEDKVASIIHYDWQASTESTVLFLVTQIVGEENMPSLKISENTDGIRVISQGAFSADLETFYYVVSAYPYELGNPLINTTVTKRVYHRIVVNGIPEWSLYSSEVIPYAGEGLYWDDTNIDSSGTVGTFYNPESLEYLTTNVYNPYTDGNFGPDRWPGEQTLESKTGWFEKSGESCYQKYMGSSFAPSVKTLEAVVANNDFDVLKSTNDDGHGNHTHTVSTGWIDGLGAYTFDVGGLDGETTTQTYTIFHWYILGRDISSFNGNYGQGTVTGETHQADEGGGYRDRDNYRKDIFGTASITNYRKTIITLESNYQRVVSSGSQHDSWDSGYVFYPFAGSFDTWYNYGSGLISPPVTEDVVISQTDLVYPVYAEDIISVSNGFYCADTELNLAVYGAKYRGQLEDIETWKIFFKQNGFTREVTNEFREYFSGKLLTIVTGGEVVERTVEQKLTDMDNYLTCCFLKKDTYRSPIQQVRS